jgi:hypothetical protein
MRHAIVILRSGCLGRMNGKMDFDTVLVHDHDTLDRIIMTSMKDSEKSAALSPSRKIEETQKCNGATIDGISD